MIHEFRFGLKYSIDICFVSFFSSKSLYLELVYVFKGLFTIDEQAEETEYLCDLKLLLCDADALSLAIYLGSICYKSSEGSFVFSS